MRGHAYYLNGNLFDSEESYIKALRIKPAPKDPVLQERLGLVYAKRKSWKDAKTVFLKCCKSSDFLPSTTAWLYLGISCFRLYETSEAEDALNQANILDNLNYRVWGMMAILALYKFRNPQALLCVKEAIRLGLAEVDSEILIELGDIYSTHQGGMPDLAIDCFQRVVTYHPNIGEAWQKLGNAASAKGDINLSIDALKKAIELIDGEGNRQKIALTLQELLISVGDGREEEIAPYRKYLSIQSSPRQGETLMNASFGM